MSAFLAARQVYCIDAPRLWRVIWLLPAMMSGIVTIFTGILEVDMVGTWQFLLTRTNLLLCVVVVYWVLLSALDGLRQQRHDLRHQLTAIRGLAGEDNPPLNSILTACSMTSLWLPGPTVKNRLSTPLSLTMPLNLRTGAAEGREIPLQQAGRLRRRAQFHPGGGPQTGR